MTFKRTLILCSLVLFIYSIAGLEAKTADLQTGPQEITDITVEEVGAFTEIRINTNFGLTYIDYERPETAGELAKKKAVEEKKRKRELAELARLEKKLADAYFGLGIHMCVDFYTLGVLLYCRTHRFVQISVGARGYLSFDRDRKVLL